MVILPFIDYALTNDALEVKLFGHTARRIAYSDMESVKRGMSLFDEHWDRRLDFWRAAVTIRRKSGLIRNFRVTPDDPDGFISDVSSKIASA